MQTKAAMARFSVVLYHLYHRMTQAAQCSQTDHSSAMKEPREAQGRPRRMWVLVIQTICWARSCACLVYQLHTRQEQDTVLYEVDWYWIVA